MQVHLVTNLPPLLGWLVRLYNLRGTAELQIKEGKLTFGWTRLSSRRLRHNEMRLHRLASSTRTLE